ncbi:hypothetical protein D3C76_1492710 [compost metagenome]
MVGGPHVLDTTAIHQVDVVGAEPGHLHRHVDGGVAGAEDDAVVSQRQLGQVVGLAQLADIVGGRHQAGRVFML